MPCSFPPNERQLVAPTIAQHAPGLPLKSTPAGGALVLTIDRPPGNALDLPTIETLRKTFATRPANPPHDGAVAHGAGERGFSAGVDTRAIAGYDEERRRAMVLEITAMTAALLA